MEPQRQKESKEERNKNARRVRMTVRASFDFGGNVASFTPSLVQQVSQFLQDYMMNEQIECLTADECAKLLAERGILPNDVGPKPGFNFRQMLREGRDGEIPLVSGASQERPHTRWFIGKIK